MDDVLASLVERVTNLENGAVALAPQVFVRRMQPLLEDAAGNEPDNVVRDGKGIPVAIRLFDVGSNLDVEGNDAVYDPDAREEMTDAQQKASTKGFHLDVDLAHLSLFGAETIEGNASYAWWDLSFEDDGIWARNIRWTNKGVELVMGKTFRHYSPAFTVFDAENGDFRIKTVVNFSLTNHPATARYAPLTNSRRFFRERQDMDKTTQERATVESIVDAALATHEADGDTDIELRKANVAETVEAPEPNVEARDEDVEANVSDELAEKTPEELIAIIEALQAEIDDLKDEGAQRSEPEEDDETKRSKLIAELNEGGFLTKRQFDWAKKESLAGLQAFASYRRKSPPLNLGRRALGNAPPKADIQLHTAFNSAEFDRESLRNDPRYQRMLANLTKTISTKDKE